MVMGFTEESVSTFNAYPFKVSYGSGSMGFHSLGEVELG
jgi:hypothetical protein